MNHELIPTPAVDEGSRAFDSQAVPHTTPTNPELHEARDTTLEDDMQAVGKNFKKYRTHYRRYGEKRFHKPAVLLGYKRRFAEPLLGAYHRYIEQYPDDQSRFIDQFADSMSFSTPHKTRRFIRDTLAMQLTIEQTRTILAQHGIDTALPTDDQVRIGADVCIEGAPYHFRFSNQTKAPAIIQQGGTTELPVVAVPPIYPRGTETGTDKKPAYRALKRALSKNIAELSSTSKKLPVHTTGTSRPTKAPLTNYEERSVITQGLPKDFHIGITGQYNEARENGRHEIENMRGERLALQLIDIASDGSGEFDSPTLAAERLRASRQEDEPSDIHTLKLFAARLCHGRDIAHATVLKAIGDSLHTSEFRDLYIHLYEWSHPDKNDSNKRLAAFMNALSGFRVEASVAAIARAAGYNVEPATKEQDNDGIDLFIDGIPFDIKASTSVATRHIKAYDNKKNHYHPIIFTPPLTAADFGDELVVPERNIERVLTETNFCEMIDEAVSRYINMGYPDDTEPESSLPTHEPSKLALMPHKALEKKLKKQTGHRRTVA